MLAQHRPLQSIRAFQHDGIVVGRVHFCIANRKILAAVDVDTVTVGVDSYVVDGANVAARRNDGKVSTTIDGDVTDGDVAAQFQGNGFVTCADRAPPGGCPPSRCLVSSVPHRQSYLDP